MEIETDPTGDQHGDPLFRGLLCPFLASYRCIPDRVGNMEPYGTIWNHILEPYGTPSHHDGADLFCLASWHQSMFDKSISSPYKSFVMGVVKPDLTDLISLSTEFCMFPDPVK